MSSEPNKPGFSGQEDSWEGLAEDLFGIDFSKDEIGETPVLSDEDIAEVIAEESAVEVEAEPAVVPDAAEEEQAGTPESVEAEDSQSEDAQPASERGEDPERDAYWNALEDWDWDEKSAKRSRSRPRQSGSRDRQAASSSAESAAPATDAHEAPATSFREEFAEDVAFGIGILDDVDFGPSPAVSPSVEEPRPQAEQTAESDSIGEAAESQVEECVPEIEAVDNESISDSGEGLAEVEEDTDPESADSEIGPRKRRRRRRRRRSKSDDADDATAIVEQPRAVAETKVDPVQAADGFGVFIDDVVEKKEPVAEKRSPRRRSRRRRGRRETVADAETRSSSHSDGPQDDESEFSATAGDGGDVDSTVKDNGPPTESESHDVAAYRDLPTWEEAIAYLLDPSLVGSVATESDSDQRTGSRRGSSKGGKSSGRRGRRKK